MREGEAMNSPRADQMPGYQSVEKAMAEYRAMVEDAHRFRWLISLTCGHVCTHAPSFSEVNFPHILAENAVGQSLSWTWTDAVVEAIDKMIAENPEGSP